jgi:hypothetical protein
MSDKAHQPEKTSSSDTNRQTSLDSDTVNRIKSEIIGGLGSQAAGQTRARRRTATPRSREREKQAAPAPAPMEMQPIESAYRRVANEKVSLRQGSEITEVTMGEAVVRSQFKSAIGGNARSQADAIRGMAKAEARDAAIIASDHEVWRRYCEFARDEIAEAKRLGLPTPTRLPHPDDLVFEPNKRVRCIGPANEEGRKLYEENLRFRDQLILWNELDERVRKLPSKQNPEERISAAYLYLMTFQNTLPPRMRLNDIDLMIRMNKVHCMSMRVLLKTLHAGWRALGRPCKRGTLPPPLEVAKKHIKSSYEFAAVFQSGELDLERFANGIIDEHTLEVLERIGMVTREAPRQ